jgi:hypothetical protein
LVAGAVLVSSLKGALQREGLEAAIAHALATITDADAVAFFSHCGYRFSLDWDQCFCS